MKSFELEAVATEGNYEEKGYLLANPDVAQAVKERQFSSGKQHFEIFGKYENRLLRLIPEGFIEAKKAKQEQIRELLREDMPFINNGHFYDFLTEELRSQFKIIDTDAVSSNGYDKYIMDLINKYSQGWILDCGAGRRPTYFSNVVNFEIAPYNTTDVRGVGEVLPFKDNTFNAIISVAVLEHVKDPFLCAREIARVLKPGGDLFCSVPFLQPVHGYPHHYYNMTYQGLANLFEGLVKIDKLDVYSSVLPIWSLTWMIKSWAEGLEGEAKKEFLNLKLSELMESGDKYLDRSFVKSLSQEKNFELASATVLFAHKE